MIGQSLGRYHLLEQLGEGGMATVYKAFDTRLEREVAVKVLLQQRQQTERFLKRFEREAKALAQLSHPNVVKVLDYGEHEGTPYLVMEYIPGGTLKQKLGKPLPPAEAAKLLAPIARALEYAHQHKIIHRDIKPSNILLTESGQPMLSDFGIAKMLEAEETMDLTGTGVGVGTPEYMSPEQGLGRAVDHRADNYSLGIVFYELVTGRKPYQADTPMAVVVKQIHDPLPRPKQFVKELPDTVECVILKALAKEPQDRFHDMGAFATTLENLAQGRRVSVGRVTRAPGGALRRSPVLIAAISGLAMLAVGVIASAIFFASGAGDRSATGQNTAEGALAGAGDTAVIRMTATASPTNAPPSPTATRTPTATLMPTAIQLAGVLMNDNFDNPVFDGSYDAYYWYGPTCASQGGREIQQDGTLMFDIPTTVNGSCTWNSRFGWQPDKIGYIQGKLMLKEYKSARNWGGLIIGLNTQLTPSVSWQASCQISVPEAKVPRPVFNCHIFRWENTGDWEYSTDDYPVNFGEWHTARIEVEQQTPFLLKFYLDDELIGSHTPTDANTLAVEKLKITLGIWTPGEAKMAAYLDDVILGAAP